MTPAPDSESRLPVGSSARSSVGLTHDRAGDGDPLALAAGQLVRVVVQPVAQADTFQGDRGPAAALAGEACRCRAGRSATLSSAVTPSREVELLEDEPDGEGAQRGELVVAQAS